MPQYLIRKNCNGFVLRENPSLHTFVNDMEASIEGDAIQNRLNQNFLESTGRRMPCPTVEVLRLIHCGIPARLGKSRDRREDKKLREEVYGSPSSPGGMTK